MPGSDTSQMKVLVYISMYSRTVIHMYNTSYMQRPLYKGSTLLEVSLYMHTYIRLVGLTVSHHPHFSILRQHSCVVYTMACEVE